MSRDTRLSDAERRLVDATLSTLGYAGNYQVMDETPSGPRLVAIYANDLSSRCRVVRTVPDESAAISALAAPYRLGRVIPEFECGLVGYVVDPAAGTVRAVLLDTDDYEDIEPPIEGLRWREPALAGPDGDEGIRFDGGPVADTRLPVAIDAVMAQAISRTLETFEVSDVRIHSGEAERPDFGTPARTGAPALVVYGEPGEVRRIELYEDVALATFFATFPAAYGLVPQATDDPVTSAYVISLPRLEVYPVGGEEDEVLALEDLVPHDALHDPSAETD